MLVVGAILLGSTATQPMAAEFHGQGGNVLYRGTQGAVFGNRGADGRNFAYRGRIRDLGGDRSRFEHRSFRDGYERGPIAQNGMGRHNRNDRFDRRDFGNRFRGDQPRVLALRNFSTRRGSGVSVISRSQPDYDFISNYAGSVDVYHANGGTYITGYGDGDGGGRNGTQLRPRAKIIDVARMHNSCAYEHGVCVIRP